MPKTEERLLPGPASWLDRLLRVVQRSPVHGLLTALFLPLSIFAAQRLIEQFLLSWASAEHTEY